MNKESGKRDKEKGNNIKNDSAAVVRQNNRRKKTKTKFCRRIT